LLTKLALEVVAQDGVDPALKTAVADRCVRLLTSPDDALVCGAIRCLVGIGEIKRISLQILTRRIHTAVPELRNCIIAVLGRLIADSTRVPNDVLDTLATLAPNDETASTAVIAACQNPASARLVLQGIGAFSEKTRLRILLVCLRAPELFEDLRPILKSVVIDDPGLTTLVDEKLRPNKPQ
jgi:hypothetical protein